MTSFSPTSSLDLAPEPMQNRRPAIAATVDAGLAGLLSAVLANQRGLAPSDAQAETDDLFETEGMFETEDMFEALESADQDGDEEDVLFAIEDPSPSATVAPVDEDESLFEDTDPADGDTETESLFGDDSTDARLDDSLDKGGPEFDDGLGGDPPVWAAVITPPAQSAQSAQPVTVSHVVVHHVVETREVPQHDLVGASPSLAAGRFGPSTNFQSTAAETTPAPMLRHATDSTDDLFTANEPYSFEARPTFTSNSDSPQITPQVAAELAQQAGPDFTNNPVFRHGVMPTPEIQVVQPAAKPVPVARILSPLQVNLLIEGLAQVRSRPGEEGLPPGVLLMDVRGPLGRYQNDSLYTIRSQIDGAVRGGDMALVVPDLGIVLFCGGLFFPGDLEVMGSRLRRRALDANPSVSPADALKVTVAGALAIPGEDAVDFVKRGVAAFDESIDASREDIVVDYADPRRRS